MAERMLVHGLVVESDVDLLQGRPAADLPVDVRIVSGPSRPVPQAPPPGVVLASQLRPDGTPFSTITRDGQHCWLRCHGVCDLVLTGTESVVVHPDPASAPGLEAVVVGGMGLALLLQLRGHLVLHASAVAVDGGVLAFVGRPGMGKSTTATLLCAAGARIVTDDVLRVDVVDGAALAHRGSPEARLRPASEPLVPQGVQARTTADARAAVRLPAAADDVLPLRAVLVPYPDRSAAHVAVEWAQPVDALVVLSAFPRLGGWCEAASTQRQFELTAALSRTVPVGVATLPWGPPFPPGLALDLLEQVSAQLVGSPAVAGAR